MVLALCTLALLDQAADADEPVMNGAREALRDAGAFPWYDPQADEIRPIPVPAEMPLRRASDWEWARRANNKPTRNQGGFWDLLWRSVQYVVWISLALILSVLAYLWMRAVARHERDRQGKLWNDAQHHESASIEQLSFPIKRPQTDLLGEARRYYQSGNYDEAIVYLFSYQLVQLDRHQCIQLAKGKTNRQYLAELRSQPFLRQRLTQSVLAFEDVFFGHHQLSRERFEACWSGIDEFDQNLRQLTSSKDASARPA
jgi:hypothetical protein